jgi:hypothetical protein
MISFSEYQKPIENLTSSTDKLHAWRQQYIHHFSKSNEDFIVERDQSKGRDVSDIYNQT